VMRRSRNDDAGEASHWPLIAAPEQKGNIAPVPVFRIPPQSSRSQ
jgi:hypothetical protein